MLTCGYADDPPLPQTDLVYVAFRICYFDLFTELDSEAVLGVSDLDDGLYGYLIGPLVRQRPRQRVGILHQTFSIRGLGC
jgi:hypothetical protein